MSGIGEVAYTVLLGWMRALVDWFWSMFSGTGNTGAWNWFLSNWKIWLAVLLIGGLVVDWLMWVVRWRPYRLLTSRFGRTPAPAAQEVEPWDDGAGYYGYEIPVDVAPEDWTEVTFATLSEIDPNWAGDIFRGEADDEYDEPAGYEPAYDESLSYGDGPYTQNEAQATAYAPVSDDTAEEAPGQWYDIGDEAYAPEPEPYPNLYEVADRPRAPYEKVFGKRELAAGDDTTPEQDFYETQALPSSEDERVWEDERVMDAQEADGPPPGFDPFAPYDAYDPAEISQMDAMAGQAEPEEDSGNASEDTGPILYGRSGMWPGAQFPIISPMEDEEDDVADEVQSVPYEEDLPQAEEPPAGDNAYDPLFNPEGVKPASRRRRRRRLHESAETDWQAGEPMPASSLAPEMQEEAGQAEDEPVPAPRHPDTMPRERTVPSYVNHYDRWADTRPSRVVRPSQSQPDAPAAAGKSRFFGRKKENELRTVTGKPARPRGLRRFTTMQDEPILGLPPMDLTDPFLPAARPDNIDFAPDEGEEYDV